MNDFIPSSSVPKGAIFAVKFTVSNTGTNASGQWNFKAKLPTKQSYTFTSPSQQSLNPGDHIDFMLHLDPGEAKTGVQTSTITVDPSNDVTESNERNNESDVDTTIN
jgi:subtilase family serine protease